MKKGWPEIGDLVVCTVVNVVEFGAFVQLDEYDKKEGLIHISEVASGWVKYHKRSRKGRSKDRVQGPER